MSSLMRIESVVLYGAGWVILLLLAYAVIRLAVSHALRSHSLWAATGGMERARQRVEARERRDREQLATYRAEAQRGEGTPGPPEAPA